MKISIHPAGYNHHFVAIEGKEPFTISNKTLDIVTTILEAKRLEVIEPENDDPETNLKMLEAGL